MEESNTYKKKEEGKSFRGVNPALMEQSSRSVAPLNIPFQFAGKDTENKEDEGVRDEVQCFLSVGLTVKSVTCVLQWP